MQISACFAFGMGVGKVEERTREAARQGLLYE